MGCDIHAFAETKTPNGWKFIGEVLGDRSYGLFGWLADVRNYSAVPPLAPTSGLMSSGSPFRIDSPEWAHWESDGHTKRYVSLADLLAVDYDQMIYDRRVTRQTAPNMWDGSCTADDLSEATRESLREFLGTGYFEMLDSLKMYAPGSTRIVFWFDN